MPGENIVQTCLTENVRSIIDQLALKMGVSKSNIARDLIHESLILRGYAVSQNVRYQRANKPNGRPKKPKDSKQ